MERKATQMPQVNYLLGFPVTYQPWVPVTDAVEHGAIIKETTSRIVVADEVGNRVVFTGNFTLTAGKVTGGTMTGYTGFAGDGATLKGSGYQVDAYALMQALDKAINNDEPTDLWNLLWYRPISQFGSAFDDEMNGNGYGGTLHGLGGNDRIWGSTANEKIYGDAGNDLLAGGDGLDTLWGGAGRDTFMVYDDLSFVDRIADFKPKDDTVALPYAFVEELGPGFLSKSEFVIGKKAVTANQHLIYDKSTGSVFYDADANGAAGQVKILQMAKNLALTAHDFIVII